jgi:uncharacterized protein Yka (UPF0111/DUF47 family)
MHLLPFDEEYFTLFNSLAGEMAASATLLRDLLEAPSARGELIDTIKRHEHDADAIVDTLMDRTSRTFVTPFDPEDIADLAHRTDNVIDLIDGTAQRIRAFHIVEPARLANELASIIVDAANQLSLAVNHLHSPRVVLDDAARVHALEESGDAIYGAAVSDLFDSRQGAPDPIHVLKWKEMYTRLENTIDECHRVALVLQTIAVKHI